MKRLKRFAVWVGGAFFGASYIVGMCWQGLRGGWISAKSDTISEQSATKEDTK